MLMCLNCDAQKRHIDLHILINAMNFWKLIQLDGRLRSGVFVISSPILARALNIFLNKQ